MITIRGEGRGKRGGRVREKKKNLVVKIYEHGDEVKKDSA